MEMASVSRALLMKEGGRWNAEGNKIMEPQVQSQGNMKLTVT